LKTKKKEIALSIPSSIKAARRLYSEIDKRGYSKPGKILLKSGEDSTEQILGGDESQKNFWVLERRVQGRVPLGGVRVRSQSKRN
jgi:hypothetical protein